MNCFCLLTNYVFILHYKSLPYSFLLDSSDLKYCANLTEVDVTAEGIREELNGDEVMLEERRMKPFLSWWGWESIDPDHKGEEGDNVEDMKQVFNHSSLKQVYRSGKLA